MWSESSRWTCPTARRHRSDCGFCWVSDTPDTQSRRGKTLPEHGAIFRRITTQSKNLAREQCHNARVCQCRTAKTAPRGGGCCAGIMGKPPERLIDSWVSWCLVAKGRVSDMEFPNIVICGNCGTAQPCAIQLHGDYQNAVLRNNRQTCRSCGHWMALPEGVFSSVRAATDALAKTENSLDRVEPLKEALSKIRADPSSNTEQLVSIFRSAGIEQAEQLARAAPSSPSDKRMWAAALLGAISYAWEKLPEGALSWIELFGTIRGALG